MPKYRPKARWCEELESEIDSPPAVTVFEVDDGIPTGVLDQHGNELFRYDKIKIGFLKNA